VRSGIFLGWGLTLVATLRCYAVEPIYPDIPARNIPELRSIPSQGSIILDVRSGVISGDPVSPSGSARVRVEGDDFPIQVGIYNLSSKSEFIWNVLPGIPLRVLLSTDMRASWAAKARKLLLALKQGAYLVGEHGDFSKIALKIPGVSTEYRDAHEFSISDDASLLLFQMFARDRGDLYVDAADPYSAQGGRLYQNIMREDLGGSEPTTLAAGKAHGDSGEWVSVPAWSSDRSRIAYQRRGGPAPELVIAESNTGKVIWSLPIKVQGLLNPPHIREIRWKPDDTRIGLIVYEGGFGSWDLMQRSEFFVVDSDGRNLRAVPFEGRRLNVSAFAWSPDGTKIAIRSDYQAPRICNHNSMFVAQAGYEPCRISEFLFRSNEDGSALNRVSSAPEFRVGQLFWIR
jgi:WD40-like Beta Propeller Repeat